MKRLSMRAIISALFAIVLSVLSVLPALSSADIKSNPIMDAIVWLNNNTQPTVRDGFAKGTWYFTFDHEGVNFSMNGSNYVYPWGKLTSFGKTDTGLVYFSFKNRNNEDGFNYITPKPGVTPEDVSQKMALVARNKGASNISFWGGTLTDADARYRREKAAAEPPQISDRGGKVMVVVWVILYAAIMVALL